MQYCRKCVLPDTRPNLKFDDKGNCNCAFGAKVDEIDWQQREIDFNHFVDNIKKQASDITWDCVIPVSGGKDSTWQVIKCLEYGLKPLCVTWRTPVRTELGQKNLDNLIKLGVEHFDISINPNVEKKFALKTLKKLGSPVIPMHMALFALPIQIAIKFNIPAVIWGENSAYEYGGDDALKGKFLTNAWLKKYGVTNGTTYLDGLDEDLTIKDLLAYKWPTDDELAKSGVRATFLGHYFKWDPVTTFEISKQHGFCEASEAVTGIYNFADVDDGFLITIHHWIKWYKFGFTRTWDNLSLEIRNGRLTREQAIDIIMKKGDETPVKAITEFCKWVNITTDEFYSIVEQFRNTDVWEKKNSKWIIKDFLIDNWSW